MEMRPRPSPHSSNKLKGVWGGTLSMEKSRARNPTQNKKGFLGPFLPSFRFLTFHFPLPSVVSLLPSTIAQSCLSLRDLLVSLVHLAVFQLVARSIARCVWTRLPLRFCGVLYTDNLRRGIGSCWFNRLQLLS